MIMPTIAPTTSLQLSRLQDMRVPARIFAGADPAEGDATARALAGMMGLWNRLLTPNTPAANSPATYSVSLEGIFDRASGPVVFADLPRGLQLHVGRWATDAWYDAALEAAATGTESVYADLPPQVRALVRSTWTRRVVRVRDLVSVLPSMEYAAATWNAFAAENTFGIDYATVFTSGASPVPIMLYEDRIHRDLVPYLMALLLVAPDADVRVIAGQPGDASAEALPEPRFPAQAWTADGSRIITASEPLSEDDAAHFRQQSDRARYVRSPLRTRRAVDVASAFPYLPGRQEQAIILPTAPSAPRGIGEIAREAAAGLLDRFTRSAERREYEATRQATIEALLQEAPVISALSLRTQIR